LAEDIKIRKMCFVFKSQGHIFEDQWGIIHLDLVTQDQDVHRPVLQDPQGQ
jgi:hypothetical protein